MNAGINFEVLVYCLLVLFWGVVTSFTCAHIVLVSPKEPAKEYRRIQLFFVLVSAILFVDSAYWAITNIAHFGFIDKAVEPVLRTPWLVATEKTLVLVSGVVFLLILLLSASKLSQDFEQSYFSKFVDYTWDAIGILDEEGKMRFWNVGSERLFGWSRDEVCGRHIKEFMVPTDLHDEIDNALRDIKATKQAKRNMRTTRLTAEGKRIPVDITISPILDDKIFHGYFGIMRAALPNSIADFKRFQNLGNIANPQGDDAYVFVAMPFSTDIVPEEVWSLAIEGATATCKMRAYRVDQVMSPVRLVDHIFNSILNAELIIADLTGGNPNVYYELGLAHALDKTVIQLIGDQSKIPFDVAGIRTIMYDPTRIGELKQKLCAAINDCLQDNPSLVSGPIHPVNGKPQNRLSKTPRSR